MRYFRIAVMYAAMTVLAIQPSVNLASPEGPKSPEKLPPPPTKVSEQDLTGYYTCEGEEAGGKEYTGVASVVKKSEVYLVSWNVGAASTFSGIGIQQGNNFAVGWSINTEKGVMKGSNLYRIEVAKEGPRLVGFWATLPGNAKKQPETLTWLKAMNPPKPPKEKEEG